MISPGPNDLAIVLARKIEPLLWQLCRDFLPPGWAESPDKVTKAPPSFFAVREALVRGLEPYISTLGVTVSNSPDMERELSLENIKKIRHDQAKKMAAQIVQEILDSPDHFETSEYNDQWDRYRSVTKQICVIKSGKLVRESMSLKGP